MAYSRTPMPRQSSPTRKNELLVAVGGHAYVNLPHLRAGSLQSVPLRDDDGELIENDLSDGQEVEILAWHPGAREGLAYQIRRLIDGREWWILACYLRKVRSPEPAVNEGKRR